MEKVNFFVISNPTEVRSTSFIIGSKYGRNFYISREISQKIQREPRKTTSREKFSLKAKFSFLTWLGFVFKFFDVIQSFY